MSNAITIHNNTVTIPKSLHDKTLPWTEQMTQLANIADRKKCVTEVQYTFVEYKDAARFYERLLTPASKRGLKY